jgi:hypothetical protein
LRVRYEGNAVFSETFMLGFLPRAAGNIGGSEKLDGTKKRTRKVVVS